MSYTQFPGGILNGVVQLNGHWTSRCDHYFSICNSIRVDFMYSPYTLQVHVDKNEHIETCFTSRVQVLAGSKLFKKDDMG